MDAWRDKIERFIGYYVKKLYETSRKSKRVKRKKECQSDILFRSLKIRNRDKRVARPSLIGCAIKIPLMPKNTGKR